MNEAKHDLRTFCRRYNLCKLAQRDATLVIQKLPLFSYLFGKAAGYQ